MRFCPVTNVAPCIPDVNDRVLRREGDNPKKSAFSSISRPSLVLAGLEPAMALCELIQGVGALPCRPQGGYPNLPVIVVPGLAANHMHTWLLRHNLAKMGFDPHDWGMGTNTGPGSKSLSDWLSELGVRTQKLAKARGRKVALVGWSLGGVVARELSKQYPELVSKVITLGTPVQELGSSTNVDWVLELLNAGASPSRKLLRSVEQEPPVSTTAVFSKMDGVVAWQACIQKNPLRTKHVEVPRASHLGMTVNPDVLRTIANELISASAL